MAESQYSGRIQRWTRDWGKGFTSLNGWRLLNVKSRVHVYWWNWDGASSIHEVFSRESAAALRTPRNPRRRGERRPLQCMLAYIRGCFLCYDFLPKPLPERDPTAHLLWSGVNALVTSKQQGCHCAVVFALQEDIRCCRYLCLACARPVMWLRTSRVHCRSQGLPLCAVLVLLLCVLVTSKKPTESIQTVSKPSSPKKAPERQKVTRIGDAQSARKALDLLYKNKGGYHACDTEVMDIDVKNEYGRYLSFPSSRVILFDLRSPVGHGKVICASVYLGPHVDFGTGPVLWIDNLDSVCVSTDVCLLHPPSASCFMPLSGWRHSGSLQALLRGYWDQEGFSIPILSPRFLWKTWGWQVWHNYGFDRHVLWNHKINVQGFGGDTMHMARLWNPGL